MRSLSQHTHIPALLSEAHRLNVTVSNKQLKGGFLAYHCNSTYNVSMLANCPVILKEELTSLTTASM